MKDAELKKLKEDLLGLLEPALEEVIKKVVNGKIDRLHEEMTSYNVKQDKMHEELKESIEGVVSLYGNSSAFFRGTIKVAKFISAVGVAIGVVWAFIKLVVLNALPR